MCKDHSVFLRDARIWDFVARNSEDKIARGGWRNSYDGELFSEAEMNEYADNVYIKLEPYIDKNKTVLLEIGCASGLTMYRIAPFVKKYIGTDMASVNLKKNEKYNQENNIKNIILCQCRADEIMKFQNENINMIIINSVIQYFGTEKYLLNVIEKSAQILKNNGVLFIGDVRDKAKKDLYERSVLDFYQAKHQDVKSIRKSDELFVEKRFFSDLKEKYPFIKGVTTSNKLGNIQNELIQYRFDALIQIDWGGVKTFT